MYIRIRTSGKIHSILLDPHRVHPILRENSERWLVHSTDNVTAIYNLQGIHERGEGKGEGRGEGGEERRGEGEGGRGKGKGKRGGEGGRGKGGGGRERGRGRGKGRARREGKADTAGKWNSLSFLIHFGIYKLQATATIIPRTSQKCSLLVRYIQHSHALSSTTTHIGTLPFPFLY